MDPNLKGVDVTKNAAANASGRTENPELRKLKDKIGAVAAGAIYAPSPVQASEVRKQSFPSEPINFEALSLYVVDKLIDQKILVKEYPILLFCLQKTPKELSTKVLALQLLNILDGYSDPRNTALKYLDQVQQKFSLEPEKPIKPEEIASVTREFNKSQTLTKRKQDPLAEYWAAELQSVLQEAEVFAGQTDASIEKGKKKQDGKEPVKIGESTMQISRIFQKTLKPEQIKIDPPEKKKRAPSGGAKNTQRIGKIGVEETVKKLDEKRDDEIFEEKKAGRE